MAKIDSLNPTRTVVDLNGDWERHIHDKLVEVVRVPSSLQPLGVYRLQRSFLMPRLSNGQRGILHLDAITYYGRVFVNGHELGSMIPYLPHEFDFTQYSHEGRNTIAVEITDAAPGADGVAKDAVSFGFSGGWESSGGIIRERLCGSPCRGLRGCGAICVSAEQWFCRRLVHYKGFCFIVDHHIRRL